MAEDISISMTARQFAGIVINNEGKPERTVQPELLHNVASPPNRALITHTRPQVDGRPHQADIIVELKPSQSAKIIDKNSKTNEMLFTLGGDTTQENTGALQGRLSKESAKIMERVEKAVEKKDDAALIELGFLKNEIDTMFAAKDRAPANEVTPPEQTTPEPKAPSTGPGASGVLPMLGDDALEAHERHRAAVAAKAQALGLDKAKEPEPVTQEAHNNSTRNNPFFSTMNADAMASQAKREAAFNAANPALEKQKDEPPAANLPEAMAIALDDFKRLSTMTAAQAQTDPAFESMRRFTDLDGDGNVTKQEVQASFNVMARQANQPTKNSVMSEALHAEIAHLKNAEATKPDSGLAAMVQSMKEQRGGNDVEFIDTQSLTNNLQLPPAPAARGPRGH